MAPRQLSGRGLAFWQEGDEARVVYVTPGYQMVALDAATGRPAQDFGENGVVDLMRSLDQPLDLALGQIGLHATPIIAKDVIIVGAAHRTGGNPSSRGERKGIRAGLRCAHR